MRTERKRLVAALQAVHGPRKSRAPAPYSKGWQAPWRGTWGPIADGNSKLGSLALRIEKELRSAYDASLPIYARQLKLASRHLALAEQIVESIGIDPKASRRNASAAAKTATGILTTIPRKTTIGAPTTGAALWNSNGASSNHAE